MTKVVDYNGSADYVFVKGIEARNKIEYYARIDNP